MWVWPKKATSEKSVGTLVHILYIKTWPEKYTEFVLEKWICVRGLIRSVMWRAARLRAKMRTTASSWSNRTTFMGCQCHQRRVGHVGTADAVTAGVFSWLHFYFSFSSPSEKKSFQQQHLWCHPRSFSARSGWLSPNSIKCRCRLEKQLCWVSADTGSTQLTRAYYRHLFSTYMGRGVVLRDAGCVLLRPVPTLECCLHGAMNYTILLWSETFN